MKTILKHSKFFMFLFDIVTIIFSAIAANLLLCNKNYAFSYENIKVIMNSIILAIIIYQIYLNCFLHTYQNRLNLYYVYHFLLKLHM